MKNRKIIIVRVIVRLVILFLFPQQIAAQTKSTLAVFSLDAQGIANTPEELGNMTRIETEKLNLYQVSDKYDIRDIMKKKNLSAENCYGKSCLIELGKGIGVDKMLSGSVEKIGETILVTIRLIDVNKSETEKTQVKEFLVLPNEVQAMIRITLREMSGLENNQTEVDRLTKKVQLENATINPNVDRLNLSGPRLGITYFNGNIWNILHDKKVNGGFGAQYPVMFMFGYQFEAQYINAGRFQALVEFVPTITGVDQQLFIPSVSLLNGIRDNIGGWELAIGPTLGLIKKAKGYYDIDNNWHLESEKQTTTNFPIEERVDSRGEVAFQTGFVICFREIVQIGKDEFAGQCVCYSFEYRHSFWIYGWI
jgi:hypothetical protein